MTSRRARASLLLLALLLLLMSACGSGSDGSSGSDSGAQAVETPTGSPFSVTLTGPDTATAGQRITATLTNAGRLPDGYRLVADPFADATIPQPEVRLGPGDHIEIAIQVVAVPFLVRVQSISGGQGGDAAVLSVGAQQ